MKSKSTMTWKQLEHMLPDLLAELKACPPYQHGDGSMGPPDARGVYLFTSVKDRKKTHEYVGRTRNIRSRYGDHGRPGSKHNQAAFAFNIALKRTGHGGDRKGRTRNDLAKLRDVERAFVAAKAEVRRMEFRWVAVDDPVLEAVLEIYASKQLGTWNSFETH